MTRNEKKRLVATNSAVWAAGILASFILPLIAESLSDVPATFLKVLCFAFPLIAAMMISNSVISRAIGEPAD